MKIRIKFSKHGAIRYIGHLDVMHYFQKLMRRAEIDIQYSTGMSPHQIMSFAMPLGVGVESDGEYLDIEVEHSDSSAVSIEKLNAIMSEGILILEYKQLPDDAKNAMASVAAADYVVRIPKEHALNACFINDFLKQDKIPIIKKSKKTEKEIDLKPYIYDMYFMNDEEIPSIFMKVSAGSEVNIKPNLVMEALYSFSGNILPAHILHIIRKELYLLQDGEYITLGNVGSDI